MRLGKRFSLIILASGVVWVVLDVGSLVYAQGKDDVPLYPAAYSLALKDSEIVLRMLALAAAAAWAYFKFIKGRTFYPRLEMDIVGQLLTVEQRALLARIRLKNAGLSRVDLDHKNSALLISTVCFNAYFETTIGDWNDPIEVDWSEPTGVDVFQGHGWVESGETIIDEQIIMLPSDGEVTGAVRLELRLVSPSKSWLRLVYPFKSWRCVASKSWRCVAITTPTSSRVEASMPKSGHDLISGSVARQDFVKPSENIEVQKAKQKATEAKRKATEAEQKSVSPSGPDKLAERDKK